MLSALLGRNPCSSRKGAGWAFGSSRSICLLCPSTFTTSGPCRRGSRTAPGRKGLRSQAGDDKSSAGNSPEDAFQRELRRRGLRPDGTKDPNFKGPKTATEEGGAGKPDPPPPFAKLPDQLEKSRKLNSEGLEGLLPRAGELLKLGTTFFLAFWPLVLTAIVLFGGAYAVLGSNFVHGGERSQNAGAPKYVDPYELLAQEEIMRAYREGYIDR
ncbi:hypothetical protein KFL_000860250 [Klebsormidium nitens]|uniref:Transmembrane protein n=1 Tax=Klebsormidium nitens TaxID=105231 RepID=A0A1Y1HU43_KLENI|nr:hypothetical protein KFL_000860250 [Klebsormidium nitens]|eukprot:GAQ81653.1 hypothetical protein KFL_000860250 [Klebsormidium nitens]